MLIENESSTTMEINNFIVDFFDLFSNPKASNSQNIAKICNTHLNAFLQTNEDVELVNILNADNENCNIRFNIKLVLHVSISKNKVEVTGAIINYYENYYKDKMEKLQKWLSQRNSDSLTPLDLAVLLNDGENIETITLIADTYIKNEVNINDLYINNDNTKFDNILHHCAKVKSTFPLVNNYIVIIIN